MAFNIEWVSCRYLGVADSSSTWIRSNIVECFMVINDQYAWRSMRKGIHGDGRLTRIIECRPRPPLPVIIGFRFPVEYAEPIDRPGLGNNVLEKGLTGRRNIRVHTHFADHNGFAITGPHILHIDQ